MLLKRLTASLIGLLLAAPAVAADPTSDAWASLARADVEAIHRDVLGIHPGVRDPQNPGFVATMEGHYRTAQARAAAAHSYLDWRDAVNGFIQSFRDGHTFVRYDAIPANLRWPGFLIDGRGTGYVAALVDGAPGVANGDAITACDGQPIAEVLKTRLDAREADWSKAPERVRQAWRGFIDYRTDGPPSIKACAIVHDGKPSEVTLKWRTTPTSTLVPRTSPLQRVIPGRPVSLDYRPDGAALIRIGSFGDEVTLKALADAMTAGQAKLRAAPYVVFDLRGNRGGNSTWGGTYGRILFGDAVVDALDEPSTGKYFRASPQAIARLRLIAQEFIDDGPGMAEVAAYWTKIADRVAASPDGDTKLFTDFVNPPVPKPKVPPVAAYRRPVYILTDAGCFSSCIVAANTLIKLGGINVGEVMGENEEYGEITGPIALPSGLGRYWLPISIIRQRREDLGGTPVKRSWNGAMDDDAGVYGWIGGLAKAAN